MTAPTTIPRYATDGEARTIDGYGFGWQETTQDETDTVINLASYAGRFVQIFCICDDPINSLAHLLFSFSNESSPANNTTDTTAGAAQIGGVVFANSASDHIFVNAATPKLALRSTSTSVTVKWIVTLTSQKET